jgi:hypothetical protein
MPKKDLKYSVHGWTGLVRLILGAALAPPFFN